MRYYELTCLGEPRMLEEKIVPLIEKEKGILTDVVKKSGLLSFSFQLEPENLANLEKNLKSESQILRYLIMTKSPKKRVEAARRAPLIEKPKRKVEIGEIEQKLEEILGQ